MTEPRVVAARSNARTAVTLPARPRKQLSARRSFRKPAHRVLAVAAALADLPLPEGSLGLPLLGENLNLLFEGDGFGEQRIARYGRIWKTSILGGPTVMVYGEEDVRKVLAAEGRLVEVLWPSTTADLVGPQSLNLLEGQPHREAKAAFSDAFTPRALGPLVPRIAAIIQEDLDAWAAAVALAEPAGSGLRRMQVLAMQVFMGVVLGLPATHSGGAQFQTLMEQLQRGFLAPAVKLPFTQYGQALQARKELLMELREAVDAACRRGESALVDPAVPPFCVLDQLVIAIDSEGRVLPNNVLLDGLIAALFGNASSGPTLSKALQQLAVHPDILAALRREQQEVVEAGYTEVTAAALERMPLALATAREVLRFRPAVPVMFRKALQDFELSGRRIPKGWNVWCHTGDSVTKYATDTFDPTKWTSSSAGATSGSGGTCPFRAILDGAIGNGSGGGSSGGSGGGNGSGGASSGSKEAAAAVLAAPSEVKITAPEFTLPFGAGPRRCLGRTLVETQAQILIALLARGYEWGVEDPQEGWAIVPLPQPAKGLPLTTFKRLRKR